MLKDMIGEIGVDNEIHLDGINRSMLIKIIEYLQYIDLNKPPKIEKPLKSTQLD